MAVELLERIEANIRTNELIAPGGEVLCLVSGGPDSTCLFHALRELGYKVSALHVNYGLRGCESDDDARFCERELGAQVVEFDSRGATEAELRAIRYGLAPEKLRATNVAPMLSASIAGSIGAMRFASPRLLFDPTSAEAENCPLVNP